MTKCSFCMARNSHQGALNWLAAQVRVLLKRMEILENGSSKVPVALDSLIVSSPVTVQGGRTDIYGQIAPIFSEYIAPQPVACYATPVPIAFAAPAPVVERISPDSAGYVAPACMVKYIAAETAASHAAPVPTVLAVSIPVVEHISPALAVCAASVTVVENITPAPVASYGAPVPISPALAVYAAPVTVAENISPDPTVYAAPDPVGEHNAPAPSGKLCRNSACCVCRTSFYRGIPAPSAVHVVPASIVEKIASSTAGHAGPAPAVEHTLSAPAAAPVAENIITPAPMEFVEAALHEMDEELCRDDLEELCYVAHMSRKRMWRCVWHGRSTPSDASKSERSWRRLPKCLCYEEEFDEM